MHQSGDNLTGLRRANRSAVLGLLHEEGSASRKRLAESLGLTPAAITKIASELIDEGLIKEGATRSGGGAGRREVPLRLNLSSRCALGILINLNQAVLSALRLDGSVIFSRTLDKEPRAKGDALCEQLCRELLSLARECGIERSSVLGVGVAVRGITSPGGRSVINSLGALAERDYPLAERIEGLLKLPVIMSNNVRALFAAQLFLSRERDISSQFFVRCEYGIGASLAIEGKIWQGSSQQCAEIGHIPVQRRGGKPCVCGKCGCLETIASPAAVLEDARAALSPEGSPILWALAEKKGRDALTLEDVLEAARNGDAAAAEIVDRAAEALSSALKSVIYVIDPGKLVLYGRMFENDYYLARLLSELREGVDLAHSVPVEKSRYNLSLEDKAAGLLAVSAFIENGGIL